MSLWKRALTQVLAELLGVEDGQVLIFRRLGPGDHVRIESPGQKPRVVEVEGRPTKLGENSWMVSTVSGNVRPRHRAGGLIILRMPYTAPNGRVIDGELTFQPTIQQQTRRVTKLTLVNEPVTPVPSELQG